MRTVDIESKQVKSMDEVIRENRISDIDFVKIDTEGAELAILKGSQEEVSPKIFGLQVEVEFIEKCVGQPLFRDVDYFLNQKGFQIMDLRRQFWKRKVFNNFSGKGQLVFGDALYFKRLNVLAEEWSSLSDKGQRLSKLYKAVLCSLVCRMFDYSIAIVEIGRERGFLDSGEAGELSAWIEAEARHRELPNFPGREKLYALFNRIAEALKPKSFWGFSDSDRLIGNIKDL